MLDEASAYADSRGLDLGVVLQVVQLEMLARLVFLDEEGRREAMGLAEKLMKPDGGDEWRAP